MFDFGSRESVSAVAANDHDAVDDHDRASVADTETTDVSGTSEATSQGSLTSVD